MRPVSTDRAAVLFLAALAGVSIVGCDPSSSVGTDPTIAESSQAPSFNFTNGPTSPGPYIVRIEGQGSRVITTDPADGLLAIHGKVSGLSVCTDASTRVPVDIQIVRTPSDAQNMAFFLTATENDVAIYDRGNVGDLNPFDPAKFCPFIQNTVPVYTGVVQYRLHINGQGNLLFQWEGFLTRTSDGALLHYVEKQYAVGGGDGTVQFIIEDIRVSDR